MSTDLSIPANAEALDASWLTTALQSTGAATGSVSDFTVEPLGVGVGLVGSLSRVKLTYEGGSGPATVVVKSAAADEGSRFVATVLDMYRKEVRFYQDLSERTVLSHPTCFYADHDEGTQDFVLLLADLAGGRMVDQIGGCRQVDAELATDRLADFHAGFWNDATLGEGWLKDLCEPPFPDAIAMSFDQSWGPVQDLFGSDLTPAVKDFGDRYSSLLPEMVTRLSEPPATLSHGDYRLDNMFFTDGDVALCDWQLVDRSRGARDLAYFLTQSATPELRAQLDRKLVERYVDRLAANGVTDYGMDRAWDDYRLATAFAFAYPVVAGGGLDHADERATNLTGEMFRRCVRAIEDLNALDVL